MYFEPGASFSVNGRVGQRTKEKGYVNAPVIYNGTHDEDIGGGVSQFAPTLFNAAFFGGMEYDACQSHRLWIRERYPRRREATIQWPQPDPNHQQPSPFVVTCGATPPQPPLTLPATHPP